MKYVNFSVPLKLLDGTDVKDPVQQNLILLSDLLSTQLISATHGDPVKLVAWARRLSEGKRLVLPDSSDEETLTSFIRKCPNLTNLMKAQMLQIIADAGEGDEAQ